MIPNNVRLAMWFAYSYNIVLYWFYHLISIVVQNSGIYSTIVRNNVIWIFNIFIFTKFSYSHFRVIRNIMPNFFLLFLFYVSEGWVIVTELKCNFISVKIHFFARVRKNGFLGLIKLYPRNDQMVNIWWNNSVTSGVRAFILNLNSTGPKQQTTGKRFFKLLGRDEN